ncbi:P-loop containing nucleoside triphosphate hydrolase protein [Flagelloscypha sp. PMI_526]|nr:P-loop containing nucleoside triphosphate hydrolase protein [Flagelloscypha sp. PMI_526]
MVSSTSSKPIDVHCVVVGEQGVGKTKLVLTYSSGAYPDYHVPWFCDFGRNNIQINNQGYSIQYIDCNCSEDYDRLRPLSYPSATIFLLCFSVVDPATFQKLPKRLFPEIHSAHPDAPVLLVGLKTDLRQDEETLKRLRNRKAKSITPEQGAAMAANLGVAEYLECSALTGDGLNQVFEIACITSGGTLHSPPLAKNSSKCVIF